LEARLNRGAAYSKLSMYEAALLDYQQLLLIDPYSYEVLIRMGKIFLRCNRLEDALIKFRLAIEINVDAEEAYHGAAHVLSQQGLFEESGKLYTKALSLNPESDAILANFGGLQLKLGNFDSGLEKIRAANGAIEFNLINGVNIKNGRH
jgi:tetratricopeptide (TPR) repeat protein